MNSQALCAFVHGHLIHNAVCALYFEAHPTSPTRVSYWGSWEIGGVHSNDVLLMRHGWVGGESN